MLLAMVTIRAFRGHFSPEQHRGVEMPGIYWHFVDVMWIVVYMTVYILLVQRGDRPWCDRALNPLRSEAEAFRVLSLLYRRGDRASRSPSSCSSRALLSAAASLDRVARDD